MEQALGKIGLIGLKSGPLFPQNSSKKLDKHSLWTSIACLPKTEVLEQPHLKARSMEGCNFFFGAFRQP
jgi:hypothetical protein